MQLDEAVLITTVIKRMAGSERTGEINADTIIINLRDLRVRNEPSTRIVQALLNCTYGSHERTLGELLLPEDIAGIAKICILLERWDVAGILFAIARDSVSPSSVDATVLLNHERNLTVEELIARIEADGFGEFSNYNFVGVSFARERTVDADDDYHALRRRMLDAYGTPMDFTIMTAKNPARA